jgi:putative peptidoglycan lipid II flippase
LQSSSIVAFLTVLTFIGFFARDYYITGLFGLSAKSDIFFMISVVPMFFVSIFCVPFGQASIPALKKINEYKLQETISYFFTLSLALCLILCFITYAVYDIFFLVFTSYAFDRDVKLAILSFLPLLFFSGWVILCNSILLAREYYLLPNLAQIVVPLIAVCSTLLFASSIGLYSVIFGMVFGQLINLIIIRSALIKEKIFFRTITFEMPSMIKKKFWVGYGYLVIIAAFTSINIPLSTFVASALGDGAVSIFNLGIKFNLFFCGLFTAVFSSVVLPYFSKVFISNGSANLHSEASYLLIFSSIILMPFSVLVFNYSDDLAFFVFHRIVKENASILGLSSVFKYSVIQLPFWVYNAIILKHGSAINKVSVIAFVCIIISGLNLIFDFFLIKFMNVGGLSLSMAFSTGIGSFILLLYYLKNKYISFSSAIITILTWSLFAIALILFNQEKFEIFLVNFFSKL